MCYCILSAPLRSTPPTPLAYVLLSCIELTCCICVVNVLSKGKWFTLFAMLIELIVLYQLYDIKDFDHH